MPRSLTAAERFASFVNTAGPVSLYRGAPGPCHLWTGANRSNHASRGQFGETYGQFKVDTRPVFAHRFAWEQANGPIPATIADASGTERRAQVDHRCRRRNCVNAAHLEVVSDRTNVLRSTAPAALNAAKLRCVAGHDLTDPANVYTETSPSHPYGARKCRTCRREHSRAYQARKRAAQQPTTITTLPTPTTPERQAA